MKKQKDERIIAEINKIYKIGFMILTVGILIDLFLQFTGVHEDGDGIGFSFRLIEFGTFMLAQIVCAVLMARKGMMDDNKYAEAEVFPKKHYMGVSLIAGAATGIVFAIMLVISNPFVQTMQQKLLVGGSVSVFMFFLTATMIYAVYYIIFQVAKKRREKMYESDDEK